MTVNDEYFTDQLPTIKSHLQNQIMLIRYKGGTGTCFFATLPKGHCWVTARHVVEGMQAGEALDYFIGGDWKSFRILEVNHSTKQQDISAFTSGVGIAAAKTHIDISNTMGLFQGQSLLVYGYPHGIVQIGIAGDPFTMPLCKRGCFSGAMMVDNCSFMIMDAIINPGFSGAPVFAVDLNNNKRVFVGVISHFRPETDQLASLWDHSGPSPKQHVHLKVNLHSGMTLLVSKDQVLQVAQGLTKLTPSQLQS